MLEFVLVNAIVDGFDDPHAATGTNQLAQIDPSDDVEANNAQSLVEQIERALYGTGYPALRAVEVEIGRRIVALSGYVPSYHLKQLAQATAQRVAGTHAIENGIEVVCSR
jgi:osmotically-inducible protein OsmY